MSFERSKAVANSMGYWQKRNRANEWLTRFEKVKCGQVASLKSRL